MTGLFCYVEVTFYTLMNGFPTLVTFRMLF